MENQRKPQDEWAASLIFHLAAHNNYVTQRPLGPPAEGVRP